MDFLPVGYLSSFFSEHVENCLLTTSKKEYLAENLFDVDTRNAFIQSLAFLHERMECFDENPAMLFPILRPDLLIKCGNDKYSMTKCGTWWQDKAEWRPIECSEMFSRVSAYLNFPVQITNSDIQKEEVENIKKIIDGLYDFCCLRKINIKDSPECSELMKKAKAFLELLEGKSKLYSSSTNDFMSHSNAKSGTNNN